MPGGSWLLMAAAGGADLVFSVEAVGESAVGQPSLCRGEQRWATSSPRLGSQGRRVPSLLTLPRSIPMPGRGLMLGYRRSPAHWAGKESPSRGGSASWAVGEHCIPSGPCDKPNVGQRVYFQCLAAESIVGQPSLCRGEQRQATLSPRRGSQGRRVPSLLTLPSSTPMPGRGLMLGNRRSPALWAGKESPSREGSALWATEERYIPTGPCAKPNAGQRVNFQSRAASL
ncbi:hypothetical protein Droror1_Dr00000079 [Drosera rotundifolia]